MTVKPVIHVELGGESRPVRFGFNALVTFSDAAGLMLADLANISDKTLSAGRLRTLIWAGLADGARKEKADFTATPEDVGDWIDEAEQGVIEEILSAFAQSQGEKKTGRKTPKPRK